MNDETYTPEQAVALLENTDASTPNHFRDLANELVRGGEITPTTTIADIKAIVEKHNAIQ